MSLFAQHVPRPLADRLRPQKLADVVGQDHITGAGSALARMRKAGRLSSIIFWGPPGCGKTTIARLLAKEFDLAFEPVSAVAAGVADLRRVFEASEKRREIGKGTLLFVDEIHRFNRAQQDAFLPYVENGTVILVGATTDNPSFTLNAALLSRAQVLVLKRLDDTSMESLIARAEQDADSRLLLDDAARQALKNMADGDGRYLLGLCEDLLTAPPETVLDAQALMARMHKRAPLYDKAQDSHYNLISALHKALRGSDVDAALYWFSRMLEGGEDPHYIARRLLRFASEDVGLADPQALPYTLVAWQSYERLGSPEGDLHLAGAVIYLATAPKSNAVYVAIKEARAAARDKGSLMPPKHILNAPTQLMHEEGYGAGYTYDHDTPGAFSGQNYFPDGMARAHYYRPPERGFERELVKRLEYWEKLRKQKMEKKE